MLERFAAQSVPNGDENVTEESVRTEEVQGSAATHRCIKSSSCSIIDTLLFVAIVILCTVIASKYIKLHRLRNAASRGQGFESRTRIEVVLSHYDEDLSWTAEIPSMIKDVAPQPGQASSATAKVTVYTKSLHSHPKGAHVLPNVGREGHTYLHHIVNNYDNLADWTVFSQAAMPSFGFRGGARDSGHLVSGSHFRDYLAPRSNGRDFYMVFSTATRFPEVYHSDRYELMFHHVSNQSDHAYACPADGPLGWNNWWKDDLHPVARYIQFHKSKKNGWTPLEFYNKLVADNKGPVPKNQTITLAFANGARFAVARERIHARPVAYYRRLLKALSKHRNPIEGYFLEAMWYDVFHPELLQAEKGPVCPLRDLSNVMTYDSMVDAAKTEYVDTHDNIDHSEIRLSSVYLLVGVTLSPTTGLPTSSPTPSPVTISPTTCSPTSLAPATSAPTRSPVTLSPVASTRPSITVGVTFAAFTFTDDPTVQETLKANIRTAIAAAYGLLESDIFIISISAEGARPASASAFDYRYGSPDSVSAFEYNYNYTMYAHTQHDGRYHSPRVFLQAGTVVEFRVTVANEAQLTLVQTELTSTATIATIFSTENGFDTATYGTPAAATVVSTDDGQSNDDSNDPACDSTCLGLALGLGLGLGIPLITGIFAYCIYKSQAGNRRAGEIWGHREVAVAPRPDSIHTPFG
mmetsp:Transcript_2236/g.4092  ORF Transcript_2236/g.4092 Transcript_2236/m.4092 type:complete len:692 (-) Transcript_2236:163-2238(-)